MMIKNFLWNKKVLLVLDDVDQLEQLELLFGDKRWFGAGRRIIITTRDLRLLVSHDVEIKQFELMGLSEDKALQLFSWHAFKNDPNDEYLELSKAFVKYGAKLPLTLKTLGIFLCGRDQGAWTSTLDKLKKDPEETTFKTLLVSYDVLDDMTKNVFLDVACFHKGNDKDRVIEILDCCDFSGCIGIDVLIEKSLLYISGKNLEMHDLVQEMTWKIVRRKSKEPGRRSWLWLREEIFHVLKNNMGTEDIEGIVLHLPKREEAHCNFEAFSKMYNLKMIQFNLLFLSPGFEVLPNSFRFLEWRYYPSKSLPPSFEPDSLTVLSLPTSEIVRLWNGRKRLSNLKHMDLSYSKLIRTPDFTEIQNLKRLVLEGCYDLIEIHPSIAALKRFKILNFKNCMSMKRLPSEIAMESLEFLSLSRCVNLKRFRSLLET
ncbi:disease resistance protein Roq1-like [Pyrus x bretschneideri]|uniref:disease resistance protein Roq1-like n=1 Tax=Pyrus x bretschneideri TaxID=225117 RepID=UPI0020308A40|nr:disease resistance protein Roq1-like [Pyrus x bretschneideri]